MKKALLVFVLSFSLSVLTALPASAAPPAQKGKPDGGTSVNLLGNDISYPQCGRSLPSNHAFGIVGVNGGVATTLNPCLQEQLQWAHASTGAVPTQDKAQLYVNTGNPWDDRITYNVTSWPTDNIDQNNVNTFNNIDSRFNNPYDECIKTANAYLENTNSAACSWQYGWERAIDDVHKWFIPNATAAGVNNNPQDYMWWLDVETTNSWQAVGPDAKAYNKATLEGMVAYFKGVMNLRVGIYSTNYQWGVIVGDTVSNTSNLYGLDSWLAGARSQKDALSRCKTAKPLTGVGRVSLIQFVSKNLDYNVSCL